MEYLKKHYQCRACGFEGPVTCDLKSGGFVTVSLMSRIKGHPSIMNDLGNIDGMIRNTKIDVIMCPSCFTLRAVLC